MRLTFVKKYWIFLLLFTVFTVNGYAMRISRPTIFQLPWTEEQITKLNDTLQQVFFMQQGRYELDIETSPKIDANNGEMWLIITGNTVRIHYKADDRIYTITPDGYD